MTDWTLCFHTIIFTGTQAFLSAIISVAGGFFLGRYIFFRNDALCGNLLTIPVILPSLTVAVAFCSLAAGAFPTFQGLIGIVFCHVFMNLPLASLIIIKSLRNFPDSIWILRETLHMPPSVSIRRLEIPLLSKTLLHAFLLIFIFCFSSFTVPLLAGKGPETSSLPVTLYYSMIVQGDWGMSLVLLVSQLIIYFVIAARIKTYPHPVIQATQSSLSIPSGNTGFNHLARLIILLFLLPPGWILLDGLIKCTSGAFFPPSIQVALGWSLLLAFSSALAVLFIVYVLFAFSPSFAHKLDKVLGFVPAIPGFLAGSIIFMTGFYFWGYADPFQALLIVNILTGLPVALRILLPALSVCEKNYGVLMHSLRLSTFARLRWVYLPRSSHTGRLVFALVVSASMGDLGTILLFDQSGIITLPSLIHDAFMNFDFTGAQMLSSLLVMIVMIVFVILGVGAPRHAVH